MSEGRRGPEQRTGHTERTSDEDLIFLFTEMGDESAFERLMERHHGQAIGYVRQRIKNPADAEEIISAAFLKVSRGLKDFSGTEAAFSTWFYRILHNTVIGFTRRAKTQPAPDYGVDVNGLGVPPEQEHALRKREIREKFNAALEFLTADELETWVLVEVQGLTAGEIGAAQEISENTVKTRLHRARIKLREALGPLFAELKADETAA